MQLDINQLIVPPGQYIMLQNVSWEMFERFLEETEAGRGSRIAYDQGVLEITSPLLVHEDDKENIGDFVKALLEELNVEFRSAGSTTFRNRLMDKGIEPDQCFYIGHESQIRGKSRIDLRIDPPPDLALEIDITASRPHTAIYEALGVPELWRFDGESLEIYVMRDGRYTLSEDSAQFPGFPLREAIPRFLAQSKSDGRNTAMRAFRNWAREFLIKPA